MVDLLCELVDGNVRRGTDEHGAAGQTGQMVDNRRRRHCFAGAWRTLDETEWSLEHSLHCVYLHIQGTKLNHSLNSVHNEASPEMD